MLSQALFILLLHILTSDRLYTACKHAHVHSVAHLIRRYDTRINDVSNSRSRYWYRCYNDDDGSYNTGPEIANTTAFAMEAISTASRTLTLLFCCFYSSAYVGRFWGTVHHDYIRIKEGCYSESLALLEYG